jgi:hypothetical protein
VGCATEPEIARRFGSVVFPHPRLDAIGRAQGVGRGGTEVWFGDEARRQTLEGMLAKARTAEAEAAVGDGRETPDDTPGTVGLATAQRSAGKEGTSTAFPRNDSYHATASIL